MMIELVWICTDEQSKQKYSSMAWTCEVAKSGLNSVGLCSDTRQTAVKFACLSI